MAALGWPGTQDGHLPSHASSHEDFQCCCCLHHGGKCVCPENPVTLGPWVMPAVPITVTVKSAGRAVPSSPEVTFSSWLQQMFQLLHFFPFLFFFF